MTPLDISVLVFFILIAIKALVDTFEFWNRQDELATIEYKLAKLDTKVKVSTAHTKQVRVTRTPTPVYRVDIRRSAVKPAPARRILPLRKGAGRQMKTAA